MKSDYSKAWCPFVFGVLTICIGIGRLQEFREEGFVTILSAGMGGTVNAGLLGALTVLSIFVLGFVLIAIALRICIRNRGSKH